MRKGVLERILDTGVPHADVCCLMDLKGTLPLPHTHDWLDIGGFAVVVRHHIPYVSVPRALLRAPEESESYILGVGRGRGCDAVCGKAQELSEGKRGFLY
jgi:hypothetical protein